MAKKPLDGQAFRSLEEAEAALSDTSMYQPSFDEGERQIILLALHKLQQERPGWAYAIGRITDQLGGRISFPDTEQANDG